MSKIFLKKIMKKFIINIYNYLKFSRNHNIILGGNNRLNNSILIGKNKIGRNSIFVNSFLDFGSYIGNDSFFSSTQIGKYCSIGNNVNVIRGRHPSETFVSTHPAFYSLLKQGGFTYVKDQLFVEHIACNSVIKSIIIGNDVWIGNEVSIMDGVTIGDGAIIGTKALITKNIEPYSIIGGVPGKVLRKRFSEEDIKFLIDFEWWNKNEKWIIENIDLFNDITKLKNANP